MSRQFFSGLLIIFIFYACGSKKQESAETAQNEQKIFYYNQADGLSSLDPAFARNQANTWATTQIFSGLFELSKDLNPIPNLAAAADVSADGLEYKIKIKRGVYFHDDPCFPNGRGRELTSKDVVYSFKRLLDPATQSIGAWVFLDKAKKASNGEIDPEWITAPDLTTVVIKLSKPFGPFLDILAMPYTYIVPREAVIKYGEDFRANPVGSGPFRFKSWDEGNSLTLVKNDNYWKYDRDGNRLPYLDAVQVSFIPDKHQEFLAFQQQKLDFMSGIQATFADQLLKKDGEIRDEFVGQFKVQKLPYLNTEYIGIVVDPELYDNKNHPFLNNKFRMALNYAINKEELVKFLLNNLGIPADKGVVPPPLVAWDQDDVEGYGFDRAKAEALLIESGFGPGGKKIPPITLYTSQQYKEIMEYVQKQWSQIGVDVKIESNPAPVHQEMVDNGRVNIFRGSWLGDYTDAENYLTCFYSKHFAPKGPNKTRYSNPNFDGMYMNARMEYEDSVRYGLYKQMENIIIDDCPVIVLYYDEVLRLYHNNITGMETNPMNVLKLEKVDKAL